MDEMACRLDGTYSLGHLLKYLSKLERGCKILICHEISVFLFSNLRKELGLESTLDFPLSPEF